MCVYKKMGLASWPVLNPFSQVLTVWSWVYIHTSLLSKGSVKCPFFLSLSSSLMLTLCWVTTVATVNHMQGHIKHRACQDGLGHCGCLVFAPRPHYWEGSYVPFLVTHPWLQMWGRKRGSHNFIIWMKGMRNTTCATVCYTKGHSGISNVLYRISCVHEHISWYC